MVVVGRQPEVDKGNKQVEAVILVDQNVLFLLARKTRPTRTKKKVSKGKPVAKQTVWIKQQCCPHCVVRCHGAC